MTHRLAASVIVAALVGIAAEARAEPVRRFEAMTAVGQLGEDTLLEARLTLLVFDEVGGADCTGEGCTTPVKAILQLPARFELVDAAPSDDGVFRTEDWNDPGDFFRIARLLEYGTPTDPLHAKLGELGGFVLGHGTIANGYFNNVTTDDFRPGIEASANTAYGGIQVGVDDVTAPHLLAMRGYVRPWGFGRRDSWWHRLAVGASAVSDFSAPTQLAECVDCEVGFYGRPAVEESTAITIAGLDIEASVVDEGKWRVLPYLDGNVGRGVGAHAGVSLSFAPTEAVELAARLEGRAFRGGYLPDYFGPLYEIQRYRMSGWGAPVAAPKARVAASRTEPGYGGFGQLALRWRDFGSLSVAGAEHDGEGDTSVWARLSITPRAPFVLGAYVASLDTDRDALFDLDGTLLVTESRVDVWGPIFVQGRFDRLWRLTVGSGYQATTEWSAGAGASFEL